MKKLIFLLFFLLPAGIAFGQFTLGPKVGYITTDLSTDPDNIKTDVEGNFNFGVFLRLGKKPYFQPEVIWHSKNTEFARDQDVNTLGISQEIDLKTIEIPVLVGFRLLNFGVGNFRLMAGPSACITIDKSVSTTNGSEFTNPITSADIEDLTWGFNIGAGVDLFMFTLDVRYQEGLTELIKTAGDIEFNTKGKSFMVSLGWKIL
ncbi:MAG TPA: porin family protein [Bacteroidales bacterium]|nr:porin family protein [Bacteroidales bacterium]HPR58023.1 porin family protein [Bacteroidales bacterium]HRW97081.1 porin family protein [Bacteroidales bacterium]